jgi:hypothetical protein
MAEDGADQPTYIPKAERTAPTPPVASIFSSSEPAKPIIPADFLKKVQYMQKYGGPLRTYITRCFTTCVNDQSREFVSARLLERIATVSAEGRLNLHNWATEPTITTCPPPKPSPTPPPLPTTTTTPPPPPPNHAAPSFPPQMPPAPYPPYLGYAYPTYPSYPMPPSYPIFPPPQYYAMSQYAPGQIVARTSAACAADDSARMEGAGGSGVRASAVDGLRESGFAAGEKAEERDRQTAKGD